MSGGIGQYQWSRSRRIGGNFALTHFFSAQGSHQLKYGTQIEHTERKRRLAYSGSNESDFFGGCNDGERDGGEWCWSRDGGYRVDNGVRVDNHRLVLVDLDNPSSRQSLGFGRIRGEEGDLRAIATPRGAGIRANRYEGTVSLVATAKELEQARADFRQERVVGFDTETRPSFRKGERHLPCLVQAATARAQRDRNRGHRRRIGRPRSPDTKPARGGCLPGRCG